MRTRQERQVRSKALTEQVIIDEMARERAVSDQSIDTEGIRIKKGAQAEDQLHSLESGKSSTCQIC